MRAQITLALDNLETVLRAAEMDLTHITKLGIYSTDADETMKHFDVFGALALALARHKPARQ